MISYTAGYTAKKIGWKLEAGERVDPETGEVYTWQPPFIQMSRRPGIGAHARQWPHSWRSYAVHNGQQMPVPRFLHESWKQQASREEKEALDYERYEKTLNRDPLTEEQRQTLEKIAIRQMELKAATRSL